MGMKKLACHGRKEVNPSNQKDEGVESKWISANKQGAIQMERLESWKDQGVGHSVEVTDLAEPNSNQG